MAGAKAPGAQYDARGLQRWLVPAGYLFVAALVLFGSQVALGRLTSNGFVFALVGILLATIYTVVSFRYLQIPFFVWILSVCGFRFLWNIQAPGLPDLYLDRLSLLWLAVVFVVKYVADQRRLRGPFRLDALVVVHMLYILGQVILHDMQNFSAWVASVLMPTAAYLLAKNVLTKRRSLDALMWLLFALGVYYNVTSVAEKYDLNFLIWPKYVVTAGGEFAGRSQGPFLQAPLFGTVIGMILPVNLYCLARARTNWARFGVGVAMLLGFAGLYFTYTRGSWLAGLMAISVATWMNRRAFLRYLVPIMVVAPVIAIGFLGLAQDEFMKERVEDEDTIGSRLGTAATVFRVWRDHPVFGVGFFQYRSVREHYIQPVEVPGLPVIRFNQFRHNSIHDIYLGPLAEEGLVGSFIQFAIYALILRSLHRKFYRRKAPDPYADLILPILGGVMVGYLVGGIAFDYRFFSVVGTLFMMCAGIVEGYRAEDEVPAVVPAGHRGGTGAGRPAWQTTSES